MAPKGMAVGLPEHDDGQRPLYGGRRRRRLRPQVLLRFACRGRIAAKAMIKFALDHKDYKRALAKSTAELAEEIYLPVRNWLANNSLTTAPDINPNYIRPKMRRPACRRSWTSTWPASPPGT